MLFNSFSLSVWICKLFLESLHLFNLSITHLDVIYEMESMLLKYLYQLISHEMHRNTSNSSKSPYFRNIRQHFGIKLPAIVILQTLALSINFILPILVILNISSIVRSSVSAHYKLHKNFCSKWRSVLSINVLFSE